MKNYLQKNLRQVSFNSLWIIVTVLLHVSTAILLTFSTNAIIAKDLQTFLGFLVLEVCLWIAMILSNNYQQIYQEKLIQKISNQMRDDFINQLTLLDYQHFHAKSTGHYLSKLNNDIQTIEKLGFANLFSILSNGANIFFSAIALAIYDFSLVLLVGVLLIVLSQVPKLFRQKMQVATNLLSEENARYTEQTKDYLEGYNVFYYLNQSKKLAHFIMNLAT